MKLPKLPTPLYFFLMAAVIITGGVMSWHFTEVAKKPFWWTFWVVVGVVFLVGFLTWWAINYSKGPRK